MIRSYKALSTVLIFTITAIFLSGCKKGWLDVNNNPREITSPTAQPDMMIAPLLEQAGNKGVEFETLSMWLGYWCAPKLPPGLGFTNYSNVAITEYPLAEYNFIEQKAMATDQTFYAGIAKALKALVYTRAVDKVNNLPYSEAYDPNILRPKYDQGQAIYEDAINQLSQASELIKNAEISKNIRITVSDIMFQGDKSKWLKFINTLKLRLLIHQANLPNRESYINQQIERIKAEGSGFLTADAAINPGYIVGRKVSVYFGLYSSNNKYGGSRGDIATGVSSPDFAHANIFALNLLKADNDPRISLFYSTVEVPLPAGAPEPFTQPGNQSFRGSQFGLAINATIYPYQNLTNLSAVGGSMNNGVVTTAAAGIIKGNNMNTWVITAVESAFLQAEAIYRGWLPGDAQTAYKEAVKSSFRWLNAGKNTSIPSLSDAIFDTWYNAQANLSNVNVSWQAAPDKYKLIMFQKYMALNGIEPLEIWNDYRRNGRYPDLPVSADPSRLANVIPIRLVYPQDEYIVNKDNVNAQGPINMFTGKIWWMP